MIPILRTTILFLAVSGAALAQHVAILNSGVRIYGRYLGGNADTISFLDDHGNRHRFTIGEVQSVVLNGQTPVASDTGYETPAPAFAERGYSDEDAEPSGGWTQSAVIPAGAEIAVRTIDPIDLRRPDPRQHFLASVENDVMDATGRVVIPRGAPAHLIVHDAGDGEIAVDLRSVSVNGRRYLLNSENITNVHVRAGPGMNRRTGKFLGGGALLGTVFGAIAGGAKGAAIGALAGGAAGAGAEVATRGSELHIPSETILRFRLDHPVYLYQ